MKHLKKYFKAFTLVELVIVITILTILGTISFISFKDYFADARDANRVTTITNIENALALQKMKTRKFPTPANATSYTGGNSEIFQGVINKEILPDMSNDPKDPLTEQYYTYSIFENGKYYQIASQLENQVSYKNFINTTYADDYESVKVVGNYKFDPSLPSLLLVPSSVTASGIFDPNVCFLLDGGKNTLTSCNEKKSQMSLKDYDKSLVGYWDMETLSGTMLKDLSGNGNDGSFSGSMVYGSALTGAVIGMGLNFNGTTNFINVFPSNALDIDYKNDFSITMLLKIPLIQNDLSNPYKYNTILEKANNGTKYPYTIMLRNQNHIEKGSLIGAKRDGNHNPCASLDTNNMDNKYKYISFIKSGSNLLFYLNGIKIGSFPDTTSSTTLSPNTPLLIGGGNFSLTKFTGSIDDLKIYNRALTDEEISQQAKIAGF